MNISRYGKKTYKNLQKKKIYTLVWKEGLDSTYGIDPETVLGDIQSPVTFCDLCTEFWLKAKMAKSLVFQKGNEA